MITKALLYCTLGELLQVHWKKANALEGKPPSYILYGRKVKKKDLSSPHTLNGHVVAVCDIEVEEIEYHGGCYYDTNKVASYDLQFKSCLNCLQLDKYLKHKNGYAIHIKNLKVFDEPIVLGGAVYNELGLFYLPNKAPQNMCHCRIALKEMTADGIVINFYDCAVISIQPQWLVKILNGEKTIEVRKKVLRDMLWH